VERDHDNLLQIINKNSGILEKNLTLSEFIYKIPKLKIKKKLKYLFSDLDYTFSKQRFRLLFLKRKLRLFEYNEKNNSIYYQNTDFIKMHFDGNGFITEFNIGEPLDLLYGNSELKNYRANFIGNDKSVLSNLAYIKLLDYKNYYDNILFNKRFLKLSSFIENDVSFFDKKFGQITKNINFINSDFSDSIYNNIQRIGSYIYNKNNHSYQKKYKINN
jgi:hypothetical protein